MKTISIGAVALVLCLGACGHSQEEWDAQIDQYNRLLAKDNDNKRKLDEAEKQLKDAQDRVAKLEQDLAAAGVDIKKMSGDLESRSAELGKLNATLAEREAAIAEYRKRAEQLERIKQRFEELRSKLNTLTSLGLSVAIRNNRMMISLPGDVLFDSGKDSLKKEGKDILEKVAAVINGDASLRSRYYQVAGHTDNEPLKGGAYHDNWGLSLMRARTVLLYMIDPKHGALPEQRWSAAGFADTDPVASNDTPDGRQKNRRCELVVVPSVEEMLDLNKIAG